MSDEFLSDEEIFDLLIGYDDEPPEKLAYEKNHKEIEPPDIF